MKNQLIIALSSLAGISSSHALLIAGDSFLTGGTDYTADSNLAGQNPTVNGWSNGWSGSDATPDVVAAGLSYSGLQVAGGNVVSLVGNANGRSGRTLSAGYTGSSTATIYVSFLMQLGTLDTGFRAFELHNGTANDGNRQLELGLGGSAGFDTGGGTGTNFGLRLFNSPDNSFRLNLGVADTAVNLFVLRFDLGTTNNSDVLTVYRNPTPGAAEPLTATGTLNNFNIEFNTTSFARFAGSQAAWDELRIGDDFASVTPVPEPGAAMLALVPLAGFLLRRRRSA